MSRPNNSSPIRLLVLTLAVLTLAKAALTDRIETIRKDHDRGDIPGWAIAAGASVVLGLLVWAAVQGVVSNYINKIDTGSK
jgi:hypothetical protein